MASKILKSHLSVCNFILLFDYVQLGTWLWALCKLSLSYLWKSPQSLNRKHVEGRGSVDMLKWLVEKAPEIYSFFFFFYFRFKPDIRRETLSCFFVQWESYILSQLLFLVSPGSKFLLLWTKFSGWKAYIAIPELNSSRYGIRLLFQLQ